MCILQDDGNSLYRLDVAQLLSDNGATGLRQLDNGSAITDEQ